MTELELAALEVVATWKAMAGGTDGSEALDPTFSDLKERAQFMEAMGRLEAASGFERFNRKGGEHGGR